MRQHSNSNRPVDGELIFAIICFAIMLAVCASLFTSCAGMPEPSGPKRHWNPPTYTYEPNINGKCQLVDLTTGHTVDCSSPEMYDMTCTRSEAIEDLEKNVLPMCKVWR